MQTQGRRVILAGGSGLLGQRLAAVLRARGDVPVVLTRSPRPGHPEEVAWDGPEGFTFRYPTVEQTLADAVRPGGGGLRGLSAGR